MRRDAFQHPDGKDGKPSEIRGVPVLVPGTASAAVKFELAEGDPVLLVASSRDLRRWRKGGGWDGGTYDPESFAAGNDLNDLMAIPFRRESHGKTEPKTTVTIGRDGEVTANAGTLPVNLSTHAHMTAVGPSDPGKG